MDIGNLTPQEIQLFNLWQRIIPKLARKGFSNLEIFGVIQQTTENYGLKKPKLYYTPNDFAKGEYATIRPLQPKQELYNRKGEVWAQMVESSNLKQVAYSKKQKIMEVGFKPGKSGHTPRYRYYQIPIRIFKGLLLAPSHGKYFWKNIRRRPVRYRRIA